MSDRGEVLVAIINNSLDYEILCGRHWYRIPVNSIEKWVKKRWPPQWLAFYQTKAFGLEAHSIRYYGEVEKIRKVFRYQLFPNEPRDENSRKRYYQIFIKTLKKLPQPIYSRRFRRIVFIPTTWKKFTSAAEINDLYDDSNLEDRLWAEFKRWNIPAERQEFITAAGKNYALDFAVYCNKGNLDVEADGDKWHANPDKSVLDNIRDNNLKTSGWQVLRFSSSQIREEAATYCVPTIAKVINDLDGPDEGRIIPRKINPDETTYQASLFDDI